jgi:hypothetical protein
MEKEPEEPQQIALNVGNLDTARMTLRWALERIRNLEKTLTESHKLLKDATSARESAVTELDSYKARVDERARELAEKERFVGDMQGILNDLFKGEVQVADFVKRRQQLEAEQKALEGKVRKRLDDAEQARQRDIQQHNRMLADMEATYTSALADAQKNYHGEVEKLRLRHEGELRHEKERYADFKEEAAREVKVQEEQYNQKLILLEREWAEKRKGLQEDFDRLKTKLIAEHERSEAVRGQTETHLRERWEKDLTHLRGLLEERAARAADLEQRMKELEARGHEKGLARSRDEEARLTALRREYEGRVQDLRRESDALRQHHHEELRKSHDVLKERENAFDIERGELIDARGQMREELTQQFATSVESLQARGAEHQAQALKRLEVELREKMASDHQQADLDLDALRRYYETQLENARQGRRQEADAHSDEITAVRKESVRQRSEQEGEHGQELGRLRQRVQMLQDALTAQRAEILQQQNAVRAEDAGKNQEVLAELRERFETVNQENLARARQVALQELEAVRHHFKDLLRKREEDSRNLDVSRTEELKELRDELSQKLGAPSDVRETEIRKREEAIARLEKFFFDRINDRTADTAKQLEQMRRHHQQATEGMRRELDELAQKKRTPQSVAPTGRLRAWAAGLVLLGASAGALALLWYSRLGLG